MIARGKHHNRVVDDDLFPKNTQTKIYPRANKTKIRDES